MAAIVIKMENGRYYYGHTDGRILTAWSVLSAQFFFEYKPDEIKHVTAILKKRGKKFSFESLKIEVEPFAFQDTALDA